MGSVCTQGWRGGPGRGSSRRLGGSRQQRGGGLAGTHWSMRNRGADEAGPRKTTGQGGVPVYTGACVIGMLMRQDRERQQVTWVLLYGDGAGSRGKLGGRHHPYCKQGRISQKACFQAQGRSLPGPKREGLRVLEDP